MKKLGLWMMAAILLCGSVVTFIACRGNSLEDIIGNVDNGSTGDKTAVLIKAIQDAAKVKIDYKWAGADKSIEFQYDADEGKFSITGAPSGNIKYDLRYDENTKKVIFTAVDIYIDGGSVIGCRPYFAIIFNVSDDKYSVVNYVEGYDFEKVYINNEDVTNVLTNACPNKVKMVTIDNDGEHLLFNVYYAEGETWADIYERYKDADVYEAYSVFNGGGDDASVTLMYLGTSYYDSSKNYDLYYNNNTPVKYGHTVGQFSDGNDTDTYVMVIPTITN